MTWAEPPREAPPVRREGAFRGTGPACRARRAGPAPADGGSTRTTHFCGKKSPKSEREGAAPSRPPGKRLIPKPPFRRRRAAGREPHRRSSDFGDFLPQAAPPLPSQGWREPALRGPRAEIPLLDSRLGEHGLVSILVQQRRDDFTVKPRSAKARPLRRCFAAKPLEGTYTEDKAHGQRIRILRIGLADMRTARQLRFPTETQREHEHKKPLRCDCASASIRCRLARGSRLPTGRASLRGRPQAPRMLPNALEASSSPTPLFPQMHAREGVVAGPRTRPRHHVAPLL